MMSIKPTDLRQGPFEASAMIDLSTYKLNTEKMDLLLKQRQNLTPNNILSSHFSKQLTPLIEDEKDRILLTEMLTFLIQINHIKDKDLNNSVGNLYFNSQMSLDLKEKFSSASKITIPYITYIFAFKFDFLHINWMKIFTKLLDLITIINLYMISNNEKLDIISNILHVLIIPLDIYTKQKNLQNSYSFCIGLNEISTDLIFFLEQFRETQFSRLNLPENIKPKVTLSTYPIILLHYMQIIRKLLFKNCDNNNHYKLIKSTMLKEMELLFKEKSNLQEKIIEARLKLECFNECKVLLIDISEIDETYFESFENRKRNFNSIFNHVSQFLFKDINLNFCCHSFKGLLIICFQWNSTKRDIITHDEDLSKKFILIIENLFEILSMKHNISQSFFKIKRLKKENNEQKVQNSYQETKEINTNNHDNLKYFKINQNKNLKFYSEKTYAFKEEEWLQMISTLCRKFGYTLPINEPYELISVFEVLQRIEKIKFLQKEIFSKEIFDVVLPEEFELFFFRVLRFLLGKKEKLVNLIEMICGEKKQKVMIEMVFGEIFNEISSDFENLTDFMQIYLFRNLELLIEEFRKQGYFTRDHILLNLMTNYFSSSYLKDFFYENYLKLAEKSLNDKEIDSFLSKKDILDVLRIFFIIAFDVENIQNMNFYLKNFLLQIKNLVFDSFANEDEIEKYKFLGLFFIHGWFFSFLEKGFHASDFQRNDLSKCLRIKQALESLLFDYCPWTNDLSLYIITFFAFLKEDIAFIEKNSPNYNYNHSNILNKSEFLNCSWFLFKTESLSVLLHSLKIFKELNKQLIIEEMLELKEFLWSYPKIDNILVFLKENEGEVVSLNFNKFLDENNLLPLSFNKTNKSINPDNLEILKYLYENNNNGVAFLNEMKKINQNLKINNIDIGTFQEFNKNYEKKDKNIKFIDLSSEKKPYQKILDKNPYSSITNEINFYKIDKRLNKLTSLIEIGSVYINKRKIVENSEKIKNFIANVNKNWKELNKYKILCESTAKDIFALEAMYEKFN